MRWEGSREGQGVRLWINGIRSFIIQVVAPAKKSRIKTPPREAFLEKPKYRLPRLKGPSGYLDEVEKRRSARLAVLQGDKQFVIETEKIKTQLQRLRKKAPINFGWFFTRIPLFRPHKLGSFISRIKDADLAEGLKAYANYSSRFGVLLLRTKRSFRVVPTYRFKSTCHAIVKNGRLRILRDEFEGEGEPCMEDLADDDLNIPLALNDLIRQSRAKVIQVDDHSGSSILHQLENLGYDSETLTFILHVTSTHKFIFCLVGERVPAETTWRLAGKAITALQKQFYGRAKAGRPANLNRTKKAIRVLKRRTSTRKEKAFELVQLDQKLETPLRYLTRIRRELR